MKKTIQLEGLVKTLKLSAGESREIYEKITGLIENGYIIPVKNSGTNGNRKYPLYKKYRILKISDDDLSEEKEKIKHLHPALLKNGCLRKNPELYRKYPEELEAMSHWLFYGDDVKISRKERSYQIFRDEKKLDDKSFTGILKKLSIDCGILMFYDTPQLCFNDFYLSRDEAMKLLVCENKDIWFDIREIMYETHSGKVLGTDFDGVIYGQGNAVTEKGALSRYIDFTGIYDPEIYYWGDIDRAGLDIYLRLLKADPDINISLFINGYKKMLELSGEDAEKSKDHRAHDMGSYEEIYTLFDEKQSRKMRKIIEDDLLIPQEIVNMKVLYASK